jgi:hypothetical protein
MVLTDRILRALDRVAGKRGRSRYISEAVVFYVQTQAFSDLRRRLDQGNQKLLPAKRRRIEASNDLAMDKHKTYRE